MGIAGVTVEVDEENGPVVAVRIDNRVVRVYLRLETASLQSEEGSVGLMVNGDLPRFRSALLAELETRSLGAGRRREILEHSLKGGSSRVYRNYFVADPATEDGLVCLSLVQQGLMVKEGPALDRYGQPSSGLVIFHVTQAGAEAVGLKLS